MKIGKSLLSACFAHNGGDKVQMYFEAIFSSI